MTVVLAFDCSVAGLSLAVLVDGRVAAHHREEGREQTARLLPAVGEALRLAGLARRDIGLLAVTIGPGSFTGVRVGLATARGLALGLGVPLAGLATTTVLLAQPTGGATPARRVAVVDTRLGDWFCALAGRDPPFLASAAQLAERLGSAPVTLVGPGAVRLAADLSAIGPSAIGPSAIGEEALPDAVTLGRLALQGGIAAWRSCNLEHGLPRPLYLRGVNVTLPDGARRTVE